MEIKKISTGAILLLAGIFLIGCQKNSASQKTSATEVSGGANGDKTIAKLSLRDLGQLTLTNHYETCVRLGAGRNCFLTPKMLDGKNMQLTLTLESKTASGSTHDLSVTQVIIPAGSPFEIALGDLNLSLTPNVVTE